MRKTRSLTERVSLPLGLSCYRTTIADRRHGVMAWGVTPQGAQRGASAAWQRRQATLRTMARSMPTAPPGRRWAAVWRGLLALRLIRPRLALSG
jgi:hypothetical protein